MRPYFFSRPTASEDKRAERYQARQRGQFVMPRMGAGMAFLIGAFGLLGGLFGAHREVAAWLRTQDTGLPIHIVKIARDKALAAAQAKRERRRIRNLRWYGNTQTWRRA